MADDTKKPDPPQDPPAPPVEPPAPAVTPETHIHLEGLGFQPHPEAAHRPYRLTIGGANYEHVGEVEGCWSYRQM